MLQTKSDIIQKIHLIISVFVVVPAGVLYAFFPDALFDLSPKTTDEYNFYKAVMGLYFGFSIIWILGIIKPSVLKTAIVTNMVFMLGLGFGRLLSLIVDGTPTFGFVFGAFAELFLGFYGLWVLRRFKTQQ